MMLQASSFSREPQGSAAIALACGSRLNGRLLIAALTVGMAWLTAAFADEPKSGDSEPPRLKKKERPADAPADEPKLRPKEGEKPDPQPLQPEEDPKETLNRLNKNLRATEDRLARKDAGDTTRQLQRDILKDLDSLIKESQKPPPAGGSSSQSNSRSSSSRSQRNQQAGSRSQSQRSGSGQNPRPDAPGTAKATQGGKGTGGASAKDPSKLTDLYKDIWGHLPEAMRMEMDTFAREKFMPRYQELLKQYYATLAEKGRRQER